MNKCKNKFLLSLLFGIFILSCFSFVSAGDAAANLTATNVSLCIRSKICDTTLNGNSILNISFDASYLNQNWTSANIYLRSAGSTANSSLILINDSADKGQPINNSNNMTITVPSLSVEDGSDYTLTIALWNGTGGTFARFNITQAVIVDNSAPTAPTSLTPTSSSSNAVTFSASVVGKNTTACTLNFAGTNPGATQYTMTHSGDSCSYPFSNIAQQTYNWYVIATDGTNTSTSTTQSTLVNIKNSAGKVAEVIAQGKIQSEVATTNEGKLLGVPILIFILVGLSIVGLIIFLVVKK